MSEVAADLSFKPPNRAAERPHFWRRVAERLDALAAYSTKHAVSEQELRRVDEDIKRCRQLLLRIRSAAGMRDQVARRCRTWIEQ